MATKKYLDLEGLGLYDEKLKEFVGDECVTKNVMPINNYINATITNFGTVDPLSFEIEVNGNNEPFLMIPLYNGIGTSVDSFVYDGDFSGVNFEINGIQNMHYIRCFGAEGKLFIHTLGYKAEFNDNSNRVDTDLSSLHSQQMIFGKAGVEWRKLSSEELPLVPKTGSFRYAGTLQNQVLADYYCKGNTRPEDVIVNSCAQVFDDQAERADISLGLFAILLATRPDEYKNLATDFIWKSGDLSKVDFELKGLIFAPYVRCYRFINTIVFDMICYNLTDFSDPNNLVFDYDDLRLKSFWYDRKSEDEEDPDYNTFEEVFRSEIAVGGGGGGGGYGNTGLGEAIKKTGVTFLEDDGLKFKADYVYTGITDPATITVGEMSLFAYILINAMGGGNFQDAVSVEPVSFDFSTIDCAVTRLYAEIDGVEYSLPDLMGGDFKFSFRPFFNSGTRAVVAMVVDSDLYQSEIIIKNDGNAEGRGILEYRPVSSGGGGGVSISEEQVYIDSYEWYEIYGKYEVIKYIDGIDYDSMIWYSATTESLDDFADAGIFMVRQGIGEVVFVCKEVPQNQIAVIVRWAK